MVKKILLVSLASLVMGGCEMKFRKAGIELLSQPSAKVYIDGKEAGMTPYENKSLSTGEVSVRMVTDDGAKWGKKVKLTANASTVIDWKLARENDSGYVINVERTGEKEKSGIIVNTFPSEAAVMIDGTVVGYGPLRADDIGIGDKQISISFPGYQTQTIFVKGWPGLRLVIEAKLAKSEYVNPTPAPSVAETLRALETKKWATIKQTETGFLRVRGQPNSSSAEIGRVNPGTRHEVLSQSDGWLEVMVDGNKGWISASYAELDEQ